MTSIFILCIILGISGSISILFRRRIEETIALSIFLIILSVYIPGIISGKLMFGVYLGVGMGFAGIAYMIWCYLKKRQDVLAYFLKPGLLFYILMFAWVWWINNGRMYLNWDEFSHWGLVVKNMVFFDRFGNYSDSTVMFRGYPPATALWQYFVCKVGRDFNEANVYRAMGWLMTSMFLPVMKRLEWKRLLYGLVSIVIIVVFPEMFIKSYITLLYVDVILGIIYLYLLFSSFQEEQQDLFSCIRYGVTLAILCLTKASGLFLAIIFLAILIAKSLITDWKDTGGRRRNMWLWLSSLSGILFGKFSWSIYLRATSTAEAWNTSGVTFRNIINLLRGEGQEYQYQVVHNFLDKLRFSAFREYIYPINYIGFLGVGIFLCLVAEYLCGKENHRKVWIYSIGGFIGLIFYAVGLLVLYLFTYSEYEAVNLASFSRYMSTYFIGFFGFLLLLILAYGGDKGKKAGWGIAFVSIFALLLSVPRNELEEMSFRAPVVAKMTSNVRGSYVGIKRYLYKLDYQKDKVWIISQEDKGFDKLVLGYEITPVKTVGTDWSLGEPYYDGDIWTVNYDCETWQKKMKEIGCTYVYLQRIDDRFIENYKDAFEKEEDISEWCMYQVQYDGNIQKLVKV